MNAKEILRWAAVLAFGGFGLYNLTDCLPVLLRSAAERNWGGAFFDLFLTAFVAGVPLAISYFAFRRHYRKLTMVIAAVAALCVFGILISLPSGLGVYEFLDRHLRETPWLVILAIPISLLCLFGPFYAAAWFFRLCVRLSERYIHDDTSGQRE